MDKLLYRIFEDDDLQGGNIIVCAKSLESAKGFGATTFSDPLAIPILSSEMFADGLREGQEYDPCENGGKLYLTDYRCGGVDERQQCRQCKVYISQ